MSKNASTIVRGELVCLVYPENPARVQKLPMSLTAGCVAVVEYVERSEAEIAGDEAAEHDGSAVAAAVDDDAGSDSGGSGGESVEVYGLLGEVDGRYVCVWHGLCILVAAHQPPQPPWPHSGNSAHTAMPDSSDALSNAHRRGYGSLGWRSGYRQARRRV